MSFTSDYTKSSVQIVLDLINNDNGSALTAGTVNLSNPGAGGSGKNSSVVVTPQVGSGYIDDQTVFYNRVDIATVPGARSKVFQVGDATHVSDLIAEINTAYNINLGAADYVDALLPTFDGVTPHDTKTFDVVAAANSLVWTGTLTLTLNGNDVSLRDVITVTVLSGLVYTA